MRYVPRISEAEWEVMKVLWAKSPCTANDVIEELKGSSSWNSNTVKTLLSRLVKKEVISFHQNQRAYVYYPKFSKEECLQVETESFLKRIYGGAFKPLLVNFLKEEKLSKKEIDELRQILNEEGHDSQ